MIKSRPTPQPIKEVQFELDLREFDDEDLEEVLRRTTQGIPPIDITHVEFNNDD